MTNILPLFAIAAIFMVGGAVIWANPGRLVNRVYFSFSAHASFWLLCVHLAVSHGESEKWVRLASALGATITPHMWLLKEAILVRGRFWSSLPRAKYGWFGSALVLAAVCYTPWYVHPVAAPAAGVRFGIGYFFNTVAILVLYGALWAETRRQIRAYAGIDRLELQILLLGGTATAFGVLLLMALRALLGSVWPIRLQPFLVLVFWLTTVVATTTHRVLDARQVVLFLARNAALMLLAFAAALIVDKCFAYVGIPEPIPLLVTVSAAVWVVSAASTRIQGILHFYPEASATRQAVLAVAQRETRLENLEREFRHVLKGWGRCERVLFASSIQHAGETVPGHDGVLAAMREIQWVTPERLNRERSSAGREELRRYLVENGLGVMVFAEGPALSLVAGVGPSATRWPYTYPQVVQLREMASIMEGALERAHFAQKVQHTEQLATVGLLGASLAHEIRNPLVSIKTFVQLLPQHHGDPKFREKFFHLIGDEVDRIDQLTQQLLDLASPRTYSATSIELHSVLRASVDLVATKAGNKNVQLITDFAASPDTVFTDPAAAKQVVLNLCFNAIQALETTEEGPRCIWISTHNAANAIEMAVADSGPGIAPEMRARLFQPFQTTKSSGFGLGLAICSDILANLNASISVDPPTPGRGATFRVTFPCQPS